MKEIKLKIKEELYKELKDLTTETLNTGPQGTGRQATDKETISMLQSIISLKEFKNIIKEMKDLAKELKTNAK